MPVRVEEKTAVSVFPSGRSILIIDDDEGVLGALKRIFRGKLEVHAADDGAAGISALKNSSYDAILCDMMMPTPDGKDVYEYLRENKEEHVGRLVFITGGTFTPRLKQFYEQIEGVIPVLLKPFSPAQVLSAIEKILYRSTSSPAHGPDEHPLSGAGATGEFKIAQPDSRP